jgi:hypothetical protein
MLGLNQMNDMPSRVGVILEVDATQWPALSADGQKCAAYRVIGKQFVEHRVGSLIAFTEKYDSSKFHPLVRTGR